MELQYPHYSSKTCLWQVHILFCHQVFIGTKLPVHWNGAVLTLSEGRMNPVFTFTFQLMAAIVACSDRMYSLCIDCPTTTSKPGN